MRVAFATCSDFPGGWRDDHPAARLLGAEFRVWDDPAVDWAAYDRVIIRSAWDYTASVGAFLAWSAAVGPERLRTAPDLVAFNADKRDLAELSAPTVPTVFVASGDPFPALRGEVVVKPNVSAGAPRHGRFGPATHDAARALIARIQASGRIALVQPQMAAVDEQGETSTDPRSAPLLLELEAIEPELYLVTAPGSSERLAAAVRAS